MFKQNSWHVERPANLQTRVVKSKNQQKESIPQVDALAQNECAIKSRRTE